MCSVIILGKGLLWDAQNLVIQAIRCMFWVSSSWKFFKIFEFLVLQLNIVDGNGDAASDALVGVTAWFTSRCSFPATWPLRLIVPTSIHYLFPVQPILYDGFFVFCQLEESSHCWQQLIHVLRPLHSKQTPACCSCYSWGHIYSTCVLPSLVTMPRCKWSAKQLAITVYSFYSKDISGTGIAPCFRSYLSTNLQR